ncbi:MAG: hypothetical protein K9J37_11190 [Saprospiraceae bacterium]|nr:hypothetical protein [Saprospiraceae bacterium]MCF8250471.1 hypothetical protein [Saprospiraceae bacterium]MCF8281976.1 hypothetical protein [Bacteroidales bacterium]MCF8312383.1 hypothetical protein [Saprospiraceae bacterium]MCF8440620.1 hypothetical protein [Saprospiraceae bacterium]
MKKFLPIFLAFQILATSSPSNQGMQTIFKMGAFFHHFLHHLTCDQENIGIAGFVKLHYSDHHHHEADHNEHKNLPFQHHHDHQNLAPQSPCLVPQYVGIGTLLTWKTFSSPVTGRSEHWHSSSYLDNIWQPPKA